MTVHLPPVIGDPRCHPPQDMRRQMLDPHPRQDQEARVVCDKTDAAAPRRCVLSDVVITAAKMTRSR
jgi:hypothetical protein